MARTKTLWIVLGLAAGIALIAAAALALSLAFFTEEEPTEDPDDPLLEIRLSEMQPLCIDITLGILTLEEIGQVAGVANDKAFFHDSAMVEGVLGLPYSEISDECTRAFVRGLDESGSYVEHVAICSEEMWESGGTERLPIERLRQALSCADDAIGLPVENLENPDRPKG